MKIKKSQLRRIIREAIGSEPDRVPLDIPIPKDLEEIHSRLKYAGRELFLVGGAVRDALMGKSPKDYDVATNASPEEVIKILQRDSSLRLDLTGKQFGVVRVKTKDDGEYEIATFREDIGKGKGTSVKFSTIENDVKRRDLTINALFYDMDSKEVVDYVGGIKDIEDGVIRAVGEPGQRFDEDRIRILRAIRFAGRMGSDLDQETKQAILNDNALIDTETGQDIPADRITEEFVKGLKSSADVSHFLSLNQELGMFDQILPGLEVELTQNGSQDHIAQLGAILRNNSPDVIVPALKRMRYSNDEIKSIKFLLELMNLNRDSAASLKKNFNRQNISPEHLHNFAELTGIPPESKVRGFLEFAAAPPAGDPKEFMAQGLKGPEIGQAMADAEAEAYADFIGEVRKLVRSVLLAEWGSPTKMYRDELAAMFYNGKNGSLIEKFPDGCEVRMQFKDHMDPNTVRFDSIETVGAEGKEIDDCYRNGYARSVMEKVIKKADMFGITLSLGVGPYGESGAGWDGLYDFYGSVGFNPLPDNYGEMIREPQ